MTQAVTISPIIFRMGKRIYLRPVLKTDLSAITVWINDEEITRFLEVTLPASVEDEEEWFNKLRQRKDDAVLAIVLREKDELIGLISLHKINHKHGTATTGSFIGRKDLWGKGYGSEAKMLLLEWAFNMLNLRKINSSVIDYNLRSKRALEKCGYKQEGVRTLQYYRAGAYRDEILMAVFKEDFLPLWKNFPQICQANS